MLMKMKSFVILFSIFQSINYIICASVDVKTSSGLVRGQTIEVFDQTLNQFLGIPFAEPPIGDLRFAKPKPIDKPLTGVIDATKPKTSCLQQKPDSEFLNTFLGELVFSEDCLFLNVWTQSSNTKSPKLKPVMFWIYGGGLNIGSIFQTLYNGSVLASHEVVLVSTNYRLGPFGFLYGNDSTAPGNVGLYDQNLALKWVRDNIHLFGGDKNQITIFGESAGSWSVSAHILSSESKGLFKRAILESAAILFDKSRPIKSAAEALSEAKQLAKTVNCSDDKNWLSCLRNTSSDKILNNFKIAFNFPVVGTDFLPVLTQKAFKDNNFNKDLDLMAGICRDEGAVLLGDQLVNKTLNKDFFKIFVQTSKMLFHNVDAEKVTEFYLRGVPSDDPEAMKWAIFRYYQDLLVKCPTYLFAKRYAELSADKNNVYFFELTHAVKGAERFGEGVYHSLDIPLVFGQPILKPNQYSDLDIKLSEEMVKYWTNFAKNGSPGKGWDPLLTGNSAIPELVKELNPGSDISYFIGLFDKTCDGVWSDYY